MDQAAARRLEHRHNRFTVHKHTKIDIAIFEFNVFYAFKDLSYQDLFVKSSQTRNE